MSAGEAAANPMFGLGIGPLFGQAARANVARAESATMPWMHLVTGSRTERPATGAATRNVEIRQARAGIPDLRAIGDPRGVGLIGNVVIV